MASDQRQDTAYGHAALRRVGATLVATDQPRKIPGPEKLGDVAVHWTEEPLGVGAE